MPDATWKAAERRAAADFGGKRNPGSGSQGRADLTSSDSTLDRVYLETKYRAEHAVCTLYEDVRRKAKKEGKLPVVALVAKSRPGRLICVHSDFKRQFAVELLRAEVTADPAALRRILEELSAELAQAEAGTHDAGQHDCGGGLPAEAAGAADGVGGPGVRGPAV